MRDQMRAQRDAIRAQRQYLRYQMRSMRRRSILGPILLIALGILFLLLQTGRVDHQLFWERYGHWWPFLLLLAGVILLAEWGFDQFRLRDPNQPRYRRSVGGGAVLLLVIFVVIGIFAGEGIRLHRPPDTMIFRGFQLTPDSLDELFGDKHESDQTIDFPLSTTGTLTVVNPRGDVTISGTSDDNRIHIAIHKQVYARSDSDAESKAQQLTPAANFDGSTLTMPSLDGARADLVLTVPAAAATTVTVNRGDIHINSIKASVMATANHGDIDLSAITGPATAHINSGAASLTAHSLGSGITVKGHAQDITLTDIAGAVTLSGDFFGTTHFERINGPISFHTSRDDLQLARLDGQAEISPHSDLSVDDGFGPLVVTASNRNVTLDRIAGDISVTDRNGAIELTAAPPLGSITLEDRNGSIRTTMPEHAGFVVQATTSNGDIDTDFPLSPSGSGNSKSLNGTVGNGGTHLFLTTSNGDISIHKGTVAPMPPTAPVPPKVTLAPPTPPTNPTLSPAKAHKKPPSSAPAAPVPSPAK
jgi:DUF4097 and DUF4098 domain-containing protein YvlB